MEKVTGIGGVFFRAKDPATLKDWYATHLGIGWSDEAPWQQQQGFTIFEPFAQDTTYFGRPDQGWMINFRVDDLDAMIAQLEAAQIAVQARAEWNGPVGRFARVHDPEGNPIELWEPANETAPEAE